MHKFFAVFFALLIVVSIGCGNNATTTLEPKSESDLELMKKITAEGGGVEETE